MDENLKNELIDAIENKRILPKDQGEHPGAHSEPFLYRTKDGNDLVLLRAREKRFVDSFLKQQVLYPFLSGQNLPVRTANKLEILEYNNDTYAVVERFFGHGHNPERFSKANAKQQANIVKQIAVFFHKLHSISIETLPAGIDYNPYFKYDKKSTDGDDVFLHADFNYSNFLVDDDYNLHAVFDWHPACIGPRIAEFATFVYCNDIAFLPLVLDEYNKLAGTSILPEQVIAHNAAR